MSKTDQWFNITVLPGIEDLCSKRDELHRQILQEEEEKQKIQNDLRILTERLSQVNESLARKIATRNDYDKTIAETENAYKKVGWDLIGISCWARRRLERLVYSELCPFWGMHVEDCIYNYYRFWRAPRRCFMY